MPFADAEFDHLTFTYLLRYVDDPASTLRELARVVRPGGRMASLEFAMPPSPVWQALWTFYVRVGLPALGRLVSREWRETGSFLREASPSSIRAIRSSRWLGSGPRRGSNRSTSGR